MRVGDQIVFAPDFSADVAAKHPEGDRTLRLDALTERGIGWTTLSLHVGPGTFLPVKNADPRDHKMHPEWGMLSAETADRIAATRLAGGRIVAV